MSYPEFPGGHPYQYPYPQSSPPRYHPYAPPPIARPRPETNVIYIPPIITQPYYLYPQQPVQAAGPAQTIENYASQSKPFPTPRNSEPEASQDN